MWTATPVPCFVQYTSTSLKRPLDTRRDFTTSTMPGVHVSPTSSCEISSTVSDVVFLLSSTMIALISAPSTGISADCIGLGGSAFGCGGGAGIGSGFGASVTGTGTGTGTGCGSGLLPESVTG